MNKPTVPDEFLETPLKKSPKSHKLVLNLALSVVEGVVEVSPFRLTTNN